MPVARIGRESILLGLDGSSAADLQADVEFAILFKIQDQPKRGSLPAAISRLVSPGGVART
jgi:hypothetical protein